MPTDFKGQNGLRIRTRMQQPVDIQKYLKDLKISKGACLIRMIRNRQNQSIQKPNAGEPVSFA
jgi:hypothetical protein